MEGEAEGSRLPPHPPPPNDELSACGRHSIFYLNLVGAGEVSEKTMGKGCKMGYCLIDSVPTGCPGHIHRTSDMKEVCDAWPQPADQAGGVALFARNGGFTW